MQHQMVTTTRPRPGRAQIEPAALELLSRHSEGLLATARRYSATPEDAEDAYQRGVEILLTKAPTTTEDELLPWLRTVVKHEAFAVRKSGTRAVPTDAAAAHEPDERAWTHERAERYEQLRMGAEAMATLKPQEIRCLLLKAEGLSYQEICEATGFSYTKVNRCLTEGRRAFLKRVAGIEAGAECERLAPLISKVADGEATPEEMRVVRPHMKSCLACKATLREYRATPARLGALVPPVVALAGDDGGTSGFVARWLERFAGMGDVAGAKVATVAASAVVLAGGSAAGVQALHHDAPPVPASAFAKSDASATPKPAPIASSPAVSAAPDPSTAHPRVELRLWGHAHGSRRGRRLGDGRGIRNRLDRGSAPAAPAPSTHPPSAPPPEPATASTPSKAAPPSTPKSAPEFGP